jgi:hypothetical protein
MHCSNCRRSGTGVRSTVVSNNRLREGSDDRAQLTARKGLSAIAMPVYRAGHKFFARPALAGNQDGCIRRGKLAYELKTSRMPSLQPTTWAVWSSS